MLCSVAPPRARDGATEQKMALNFNGRRVAETRDYTAEAISTPAGKIVNLTKGVIFYYILPVVCNAYSNGAASTLVLTKVYGIHLLERY